MTSTQEATLRCASRLNATVPSRIVKTDLQSYGRSGVVKITFTYNNQTHEYQVPFTRPYTNKAEGKFANLLNLNQQRNKNNQTFEEFVIRTTNNYQADPAIEIECSISLITQGGNEDHNETTVVNLPPNIPKKPTSASSIVHEKLELNDDQTHYIVFADDREDSFCTRKLSQYFSPKIITALLSKVNEEYECGNTFNTENNAPFVTIIPIFNEKKGNKSEENYLKNVFTDVIKSQNQYFKKPNICLVYSDFGFANKALFVKEWNKAIKLLYFEGFSNFLMD